MHFEDIYDEQQPGKKRLMYLYNCQIKALFICRRNKQGNVGTDCFKNMISLMVPLPVVLLLFLRLNLPQEF